MVIINNISNEEWRLILSALRNELRNEALNSYFPKRKEKIRKLIKKIERFEGNKEYSEIFNRSWDFE